MGLTEIRIWSRLRARQLDGWKFRRQHPIGPYFVDFYCPAARLVVEVCGPVHDLDSNWAYDRRRKAWLEAEGFRVVEVLVADIDRDVDEVMNVIYEELRRREEEGSTRLPTHPSAA